MDQTNTPTSLETSTSTPTPDATIPLSQIMSILKEPVNYTGTIPKRNIEKKVHFEPHPFEKDVRREEERKKLLQSKEKEKQELLQKFPNVRIEPTLFIQQQKPPVPKTKRTFRDEDFIFPTTTTTTKTPTDPLLPTHPTYPKIPFTHRIKRLNAHPLRSASLCVHGKIARRLRRAKHTKSLVKSLKSFSTESFHHPIPPRN
ncbi:unnamed protein product, partial [Trichogramma brassicae]